RRWRLCRRRYLPRTRRAAARRRGGAALLYRAGATSPRCRLSAQPAAGRSRFRHLCRHRTGVLSAMLQRLRRPWAVAIGLLVLALALVAVPLIAQDQQQLSPDEQKDWLVQFVEGQLSTPERQIRISNIEGILSEDASIREITISDAE